jgi:hypothetical protein
MRAALVVIVPWLVWGVLDAAGYALLAAMAPVRFPSAEGLDAITWAASSLVILLVLRAVYSALSGFLAGTIGARHPRAVRGAIGVLLVTGIVVQALTWGAYPTWYHVVFLVSIVPAAMAGARLAAPPPR